MLPYISQYIKNFWGWKTKRKIVTFSVDDYGNVRVASKAARDRLDQKSFLAKRRFDAFDALENTQDLLMLFKTLKSVKDKNGNHAIFTPFAVPCNIDFEKVIDSGFSDYFYETLPETFQKLKSIQKDAYSETWQLWNEGMNEGIFAPQYHGREHLNLKVFKEMLLKKDHRFEFMLKERSFVGSFDTLYKTISNTAAFDFWEHSELESLKEIGANGLNNFEKVFGYRAIHFMAPRASIHPEVVKSFKTNGILFYDSSIVNKFHIGRGQYKKELNQFGAKNEVNQRVLIRNVVFEPTLNSSINLKAILNSIEAAFFMGKPALISSHRVNFAGHVNTENRKTGLDALAILLREITKKWPDVEFMSTENLCKLIEKNHEK